MNTVVLDCAKLTDGEQAHAHLKEAFSFPEYYGNNLDALYDCLTELPATIAVLLNADKGQEGYCAKVLQVLKDAACDGSLTLTEVTGVDTTVYDFDEVIERHGTASYKYDLPALDGHGDELQLWVADMDFPAPAPVVTALEERVEHGIFGYGFRTRECDQAVCDWFSRRYCWDARPEWVVPTPGVVFALAHAVRIFTEPGDAVAFQAPVYGHFKDVVAQNGRVPVDLHLTYRQGEYAIDYDAFEQGIVDEDVKLFILCNPHNPGGRVWTSEELYRMGQICLAHDVLVVSDEIHADFARPGFQHTVYASLGEEFARNSIICTAPSKTFNLAGLEGSNIFIPDEALRARFLQGLRSLAVFGVNILADVAIETTYREGESWLVQVKAYLEGNWEYLDNYLAEHIPELHLVPAGSTYLAWVDATALGVSEEQLRQAVSGVGKLHVQYGSEFGETERVFMRINLACPLSIVEEACEGLERAIASLK